MEKATNRLNVACDRVTTVHGLSALSVLLLLVAGCSGPSAQPAESDDPPRTGEPEAPTVEPAFDPDGPIPDVTVHLSGVLLARAPGTGAIPHSGDSPAFCFTVPKGSTLLSGNLTWSPSVPMGLEFQGPDSYHSTWDTPAQNMTPSVRLTVLDPSRGSWLAYGGPGVAGVEITWALDLRIVGQPGSPAFDEDIRPDGNALGGSPCV